MKRPELLALLDELDHYCASHNSFPPRVYLVGAGGLHLAGAITRATDDLDVLSIGGDFQVLAPRVHQLQDWEVIVEPSWRFAAGRFGVSLYRWMDVFHQNVHHVLTHKLARGLEHDFSDIAEASERDPTFRAEDLAKEVAWALANPNTRAMEPARLLANYSAMASRHFWPALIQEAQGAS